MSSIAQVIEYRASPTLPEPPFSAIAHIPGTDGWPLVGNTVQMLADTKGSVERFAERYGPVFRTRNFGGRVVALLGPQANEFLLLDQAKLFSSQQGWERIFGRLFPGGLMLMDFDEHRLHRKALSVAFKAGPLKSYLESLNQGIAVGISDWLSASPDLRFYPAIKRLTLDLAATAFLGERMSPDAERIKGAFIDLVAAAVAVVRSPIPGTQMSRGVKARQFMIDYFSRQTGARRESCSQDLFTQLCKATTDDGSLLTAQGIVRSHELPHHGRPRHAGLVPFFLRLFSRVQSGLAGETPQRNRGAWPRPRRAIALRVARRHAADGNGFQ